MSRPAALILCAPGLGDLLAAVPALRALARALPDHERVLAIPAPLGPLALHTRTIDHVLCVPPPPTTLSTGGPPPDIAVNLRGHDPASHALLGSLDARLTFAFACPGAPESAEGPAWRDDEHEVARWCRMLQEHGIVADPSELDVDAPPGPEPPAARGATLLHPGAGSAARRWPVERWGALAGSLAQAGERIVITGGADEVPLALEVARRARLPATSVLAGQTGVMELARAVAAARRVVCGDTGVARLATALRRPSVVLFGPTPPALAGPPPDRPWHRALWAGITGDPHAGEPSPGLWRIHAGDVLDALSGLPEVPGAKPAQPGEWLYTIARTPPPRGAPAPRASRPVGGEVRR